MSRKCLAIIVLLTAFASVSAYARKGAVRFELLGGYVNSLESIRADYDGGATQYLSGNFGGVYAGAGIHATLSERTPLTISFAAAAKYASGLLHDRAVRESYVFAPLRFGWSIPVFSFGFEQNLVVEPYAGPVFQYGLSSKSNDYDFYHPDGIIEAKRFNTLLGAGARLSLDRLVFDVGYDFGLIPRYLREGDGYSYRWNASTLHLGLSYRF